MSRSIQCTSPPGAGLSPSRLATFPRSLKYAALVIVAVALAGPAAAQESLVSEELVETLSGLVARNFWGRAVLSSGEHVQRPPDYDPKTPIIPKDASRRVIENALPVGLAMWCGVEWRPYYLGFMRAERTKSWSEIQIAYIGVLFGTAQQTFASSYARDAGGGCTAEHRAEIESAMGLVP
jgi:hypothetical protein